MNEDLIHLCEMRMNEGTEEKYERELKRERAERRQWAAETYREIMNE